MDINERASDLQQALNDDLEFEVNVEVKDSLITMAVQDIAYAPRVAKAFNEYVADNDEVEAEDAQYAITIYQ